MKHPTRPVRMVVTRAGHTRTVMWVYRLRKRLPRPT